MFAGPGLEPVGRFQMLRQLARFNFGAAGKENQLLRSRRNFTTEFFVALQVDNAVFGTAATRFAGKAEPWLGCSRYPRVLAFIT